MAINNFQKFLSTATPNLALQNNIQQFLLWGTAGVLEGLGITNVTNVSGITTIDLTPGAFIHNGIVVQYAEGAQINLTTPSSFNLSDPLYLIAQSNGADSGNLPLWSFMSESQFRAKPDYRNFAAVVGIYRTQVIPNSIVQQIGFDADSTTGWTPSVVTNHYKILNGSDPALSGAFLSGVAGNVDVIGIQDLGGNAKDVTQCVLTANVAVDHVFPTTTQSTAQVTVGGAATTAGGERFSLYANGIEAFYVSVVGGETNIFVADKLRLAIIATWPQIATPDPAGSPMITLTSVQFGHAANFDLQVTETSPTTTLAVTAAPGGGAQGSIKIEFPTEDGSTSGTSPVTIYPPVPLVAGPGSFVSMSFPVVMTDITAATFNNMKFRITAQAPGAETVKIGQTFIALSISELNSAIDPFPPTQLSHWTTGPIVSVGGGQGTSLQAHRTLIPIDHPDRSIIRTKIQTRAVGPLEIDQFVVGGGFSGNFHTAVQLQQPWLIPSDLNLEECSDIIKLIAQILGGLTGTGNLLALFARDHNSSTGHHKSATYTDLTSPTVTGMRVEPLLAGDSTIDPLAPWAGGVAVVTEGQMGILSDDLLRTAMLSARKATGVPIGAGVGTVRDLVLSSPQQAAAGKIGLAIGMDTATPHVTAAYKEADMKPLSGITSVDNIPVRGLINNEVTLFEGWIVFTRTDTVTWNSRVSVATRFFPDAALNLNTGSDGAGVMVNSLGAPNSFMPDSPGFGAPFYADFGSPSNFLNTSLTNSVLGINTSFGKIGTGLGYFPTPVRGTGTPYTTLDANAGSEWFYLPFPKKDIFASASVKVDGYYLAGNTQNSNNGGSVGNFGATTHGVMMAPAYDAREVSLLTPTFALIPPVYSPSTGAFRSKSTGIVRRHPWVLTPYGLGRRIDFSGVGLQENSYYYNPRNNAVTDAGATYDPYAFLTRPLADYASTFSRGTNFLKSNILSDDSYVIRGALPFYDRRRLVEPTSDVAGIAINAAQIGSFFGLDAHMSYAPNVMLLTSSSGGTVPLVNRYSGVTDPTRQDFLTLGGALPSTRTPDGVALCVNRWDFGIAGKNLKTAPVWPYNETGGAGGGSSSYAEIPIALHVKITGTVIDRFKPVMAL